MSAPVRAVAAVVGFYASVAAIAAPALLLIPQGWGRLAGLVASSGTMVLAASVVYAALIRFGWSNRRQLRLPPAGAALRGGAVGIGIGLAMALVAVAMAMGAGGARLVVTGEPFAAYAVAALELAGLLALAALSEELLFRGYPLARLAASVGSVPASAALATVFAVAHVWNPGASVLGVVNIGLAALVLSAAFFTPGGLALAWGLHFGWNAGLSLSTDAPVSGLDFDLPGM